MRGYYPQFYPRTSQRRARDLVSGKLVTSRHLILNSVPHYNTFATYLLHDVMFGARIRCPAKHYFPSTTSRSLVLSRVSSLKALLALHRHSPGSITTSCLSLCLARLGTEIALNVIIMNLSHNIISRFH